MGICFMDIKSSSGSERLARSTGLHSINRPQFSHSRNKPDDRVRYSRHPSFIMRCSRLAQSFICIFIRRVKNATISAASFGDRGQVEDNIDLQHPHLELLSRSEVVCRLR
jgi:hypothetical protein